ncbi:unnamed protein product, partial [Pylaiella littoralis]
HLSTHRYQRDTHQGARNGCAQITYLPLEREREEGRENVEARPGGRIAQASGSGLWTVSVLSILAYSGWLVYKAVQKAKTPDTSFVLTNVVYPYPDLWICPYISYGCDTLELEKTCTESVTMTEGGEPYAAFYPRVKLGHEHQEAAEELRIEAIPTATDVFDSDGNKLRVSGRGHCVVFKTSEATAFVGEPRDPHEYLDFIHLDMYWYPGGENVTSTTCVPEGQEWADHREWVYAFLSDPNDVTSTSTGIQLSYSCITNTSNTHVFNTLELGLTNQNKFASDDIASYKAIFTNFGLHKNLVNPNITHPYARVSLEMKQQLDSWEIITEANPFEFAEMFGNIGGFWGE